MIHIIKFLFAAVSFVAFFPLMIVILLKSLFFFNTKGIDQVLDIIDMIFTIEEQEY